LSVIIIFEKRVFLKKRIMKKKRVFEKKVMKKKSLFRDKIGFFCTFTYVEAVILAHLFVKVPPTRRHFYFSKMHFY